MKIKTYSANDIGGTSMNYMEQVAEMLGVEIGEEFDVLDSNGELLICCPLKITKTGLTNENYSYYADTLLTILSGGYTIQKIPFKPKNGEEYWAVCPDGTIVLFRFSYKSIYDLYAYEQGNCFKTEKLAEKAKPTIMAKLDAIRKELEG